jgi:tetratricopeptide (TPR) repeat protein
MPRPAVRVFLVVLLIGLAIFVPLLFSGYSELQKASLSGSYSEAAQHYQNAALRIPWRGDLYELSGHHYYYAKEYVKADAAYQKAYAHKKFSAEGWVAWGDVNYLNHNPERALEIWEQALAGENPSEHLYSRLAEIYQSNGDLSKAAEYFQKYVSAHPEDAFAHYRLGLLLTLSNPQRSLLELRSASELDPELGPAVETLRTALDLALQDPSVSTRSVIIGRGLGLLNEWQLARVAFESAVELDEKNAEAWAWLAEAKQQTDMAHGGEYTELEKALELNPDSPTVRGLRGLYFQRTGNFRQALTEFQAAAALEPKNPTWLVSVGEAYAKNGDLIRALESYRSATTLAPQDPAYWRLLAIFCAQNQVNIQDIGVPAARQAVILSEDDANSLDVLGWLLILDVSYDAAERMLERALALDAQNASVHLHLGMLNLQTNHRASAYDHLIHARDLGNSDAEAILKQYFP